MNSRKSQSFSQTMTQVIEKGKQSLYLVLKKKPLPEEIYDNLLLWTKEFDQEFYDVLVNNKDYAIVNIAKSGKNIKITKKDNKLNEEIPKNVVKIHNTANPIVMLIFSLLFCGIFVCSGFSNKR